MHSLIHFGHCVHQMTIPFFEFHFPQIVKVKPADFVLCQFEFLLKCYLKILFVDHKFFEWNQNYRLRITNLLGMLAQINLKVV